MAEGAGFLFGAVKTCSLVDCGNGHTMLQLKAIEPRGAEKGKEGKPAQTRRSKFHGMFWKWSLLYNHSL